MRIDGQVAVGTKLGIQEIPDMHQFHSEHEFNKLLLDSIDLFMEGVFNETVKYATNKKSEIIGGNKLSSGQVLPIRGVRLDIWVECDSGRNYILELKNPKNNYATLYGLGQLLMYSVKFPSATNFVLVSTVYDDGLLEVINRYELPIDFVLVSKNSFYLLEKDGKSTV